MASSSDCVTRSDIVMDQNSVENIISNNFSTFDFQRKIEIKRLGRPTPDLNLNQTCRKKKEGRSFIRHFNIDIYKKNKWICGCNIRNSLFWLVFVILCTRYRISTKKCWKHLLRLKTDEWTFYLKTRNF